MCSWGLRCSYTLRLEKVTNTSCSVHYPKYLRIQSSLDLLKAKHPRDTEVAIGTVEKDSEIPLPVLSPGDVRGFSSLGGLKCFGLFVEAGRAE